MSEGNIEDAMAAALEAAEFRRPWRDYQARVLEELEQHLDDNLLHIVAAPGSGKTVLGLEVMRRLSKPTLILALGHVSADTARNRRRQLRRRSGKHPNRARGRQGAGGLDG